MLLAVLLAAPLPAGAQDPLGWNSQRALDLISRARLRRELPRGDSTLRNYQSKANGFVYFYLDRPGSEERTLVRVDQIAIDLFFKRPNLTKQRIVGMRDANRLPNRMYYHLDHLTVVQNGLGDVIRIGDGDEVRDVPHPAAPGADSVYDYRLADSVTLQLGGDQPSVRVYEIQVRPRHTNRAAFIGSLYVDRAEADIVRLTFTFTPASYVDRRLDYINISLDNGLFGGKYWLPNEQSVEIRRQIPELDFAAGSVIKGRIHVADYQFNADIPDSIFFGRPVSAVSEEERKSFAFPHDIYSDLNVEGLAPPPQMENLRAQAIALMRKKRLSGLPPLRLYVPNASSVLRHNDAEGWYAGSGLAYVPSEHTRLTALGGFAFGPSRPELRVEAATISSRRRLSITGYLNNPRDVGPVQGIPTALNTLTSGFGDDDYTDTYSAHGGRVDATSLSGSWKPGFFFAVEQHRNIATVASDSAYNRRAVDGRAMQIGFVATREVPVRGSFSWQARAEASLVNFETKGGQRTSAARALGYATGQWVGESNRTTLDANIRFGWNSTYAVPPQFDFLIGGRATLPGYDYRSFSGQKFLTTGLELSKTVVSPWLRARLLGYAAYTPPLRRDARTTSAAGVRASAGAGVGLFWDIIRIDVVRGARWQTLLSVRPDLWDLL